MDQVETEHEHGGHVHEDQKGAKHDFEKLKDLEGPYDREIIFTAADTLELRKQKFKTLLMDEAQKTY